MPGEWRCMEVRKEVCWIPTRHIKKCLSERQGLERSIPNAPKYVYCQTKVTKIGVYLSQFASRKFVHEVGKDSKRIVSRGQGK